MRRLFVLLGVLWGSAPVLAAESPWVDLGPALRARLISAGPPTAENLYQLGVELALAPGARTYWQRPGEAGIGTSLDFSLSTGLGPAQVHWPLPQVLVEGGLTEYVYINSVVIPVVMPALADGAVARLALSGGVCTDVCMPVGGELSLPLTADPDAGSAARLALAEAELPLAWDGIGLAVSVQSCGPGGVELLRDDAVADDSLIVEAMDRPVLLVRDATVAETLRFVPAGGVAPQSGDRLWIGFRAKSAPYGVETRCPSTAASE